MDAHDHLPGRVTDSSRPLAYLAANGSMGAFQHFLLAGRALGKSEATTEWYRLAFKDFERFCAKLGLPHVQPKAITQPLILAWLDDIRARKDKPITVNNRFRALRAFLNWCVTQGYIKRSPLEKVPAPKYQEEVIRPFTSEQIAAMLRLCPPNRWWGARDAAIVLTFLHCGLRRGELAGMRDTDIAWDREEVIVTGKGNKQRVVYLSPEVQTALLNYQRFRNPSEHAWWQSKSGAPLTGAAVYSLIDDLCKRAGVQGPRGCPHDMRHTFATAYLTVGGRERKLQSILGHATPDATQRYVRTVDSRIAAEEHRRLDLYGERKR